ncbi:hypothetical protein CAPTEDRAFT_212305 [Capitella teleta]|uniref:Uncharacterized protein n=1 Tax=Capitella teleta TaxID=283909 RepID=R7UCC9_CAPTE|nr:hypothetical protein CAPTEDRAFT_212305 [Capitella teleta]|eukprot:ELU03659.1 hypothetical protein CAPTEDRAFT_212305 [Capitella teleta]
MDKNNPPNEEVKAAEDVLIYRDLTDVDEDVRQRKSDVIQRLKKGRKRRLKRKGSATQAKESPPLLEASPSDLVGRRVLHQCSEDGGAPQWYPGVVEPIVKHSVNPHRVLFQISIEDVFSLVFIFSSDVCTSSAFFDGRC